MRRVFVIAFVIVIGILSVKPLKDFDIWFHLKSGEIFSHMGIIHHDVFSFSAQGREWYPYEWFFQVTSYWYKQVFGFEAIKYLTAGVAAIMVGMMILLLRRDAGIKIEITLVATWFFWVGVYEFVTARPHLWAYTFLLVNLYLILKYFLKGKNWLWLTLPVSFAWANMHGSIFMDIAFFGAYSFLSGVNWLVTKDMVWLGKTKLLAIFTLFTVLISILPPIGFTQYRLLILFLQNSQVLRNFINEWSPISTHQFSFLYYTVMSALIVGLWLVVVIRKRLFQESMWLWPFLILIPTAYLASRNEVFGQMSLAIVLAWTVDKLGAKLRWLCWLILGLLFISQVWLYHAKWNETVSQRLYYPVKAVEFIKQTDPKGNMFNEFAYGGYLLYQLYPKHQVFFDGRADVYLCCEIQEIMGLSDVKSESDQIYKKKLDELLGKHDISYVLIRTQKNVVLRKIGRLLTADPGWVLVFWDDNSQMFVKRDGKNDDLIAKYGVSAATPYERNPYKIGDENKAIGEYKNMILVADSAHSRNAIGFLLLKSGKYDEAEKEFRKAIDMDPSFESPYMNLAELAARSGDYKSAIDRYLVAQKLAPDRGMIYIRLGELYVEGYKDIQRARESWETGLKMTLDEDAKKKLLELLNNQ